MTTQKELARKAIVVSLVSTAQPRSNLSVSKILPAVFGVALLVFALFSATGLARTLDMSAHGYTVTERGQNFCAWSRVILHTNDHGEAYLKTNTIMHLSPGRHYLENRIWKDSAPELVITNDGVIGRGAPCRAHFAANLNTPGATELTTGSGTVKIHVLGLAYQDVATGSNVWLGLVKDSAAQVTGKSQVAYRDAFSGISADVFFDYVAGGVTQYIAVDGYWRTFGRPYDPKTL